MEKKTFRLTFLIKFFWRNACGDFLSYFDNYLQDKTANTVYNNLVMSQMFLKKNPVYHKARCFSVYVNDMQKSLDCDLDQFADDSTLHDCLWRYRGQSNSKSTKETYTGNRKLFFSQLWTIHPDEYVKSSQEQDHLKTTIHWSTTQNNANLTNYSISKSLIIVV